MRDNDRRYEWLAWMVWVIPLIPICTKVALASQSINVIEVYSQACDHWWARSDIYIGRIGMNYLPIFVMMFSPFNALGMPQGDILWRIVCLLCVAWSVRRLITLVTPQPSSRIFLWASVFVMPVCLGAVRFGQANEPFAAATALAAVFLIERRWKMAGTAIATAIALKPLGIVLALLAMCGYRRVIIPVVVGIFAILLIPFAFGPPEYVLAQYQGLISNMRDCSDVTTHNRQYANLNGIFQALSIHMPSTAMKVLTLSAAFGTLILWLFAARRVEEPERGLLLLSLATIYLMLFNPMNESNSFVIVAPAIIAVAVRCHQSENGEALSRFLVSMLFCTWLLTDLIHMVDLNARMWGKPLFAGIGFLVVVLFRTRSLMRSEPALSSVSASIENL